MLLNNSKIISSPTNLKAFTIFTSKTMLLTTAYQYSSDKCFFLRRFLADCPTFTSYLDGCAEHASQLCYSPHKLDLI